MLKNNSLTLRKKTSITNISNIVYNKMLYSKLLYEQNSVNLMQISKLVKINSSWIQTSKITELLLINQLK